MVALACLFLLVVTTLLHYEVLRGLNLGLPLLRIPARNKLIVIIFGAFLAHTLEILLYAATIYLVSHYLGWGALGNVTDVSFDVCVYFSAETFTSLGFGDFAPQGDLRLLAGAEALNGLLLIGWSASYIYIAMERFWSEDASN